MSEMDNDKRRFLIGATSTVGGIGAVAVAVPFLKSWAPSARAEAAGAPVSVDISKLQPGERLTIEWRGKPVWIVRRTKEVLSAIEAGDDKVSDPNSEKPMQPDYAANKHRSIDPEFLVLIGLCTHLGCVPTYQPEVEAGAGQFYCPCHGSIFDLAGRVYKSKPAPVNLEVPPYHFVANSNNTKLIIGLDGEAA